jgi:sulfur-oxidizing protein SoxY
MECKPEGVVMNAKRRTFLKSAGAASTVVVAVAAGLIKPTSVMAAEWNKPAFEAKGVPDALKSLGASGAADSKDILIKAPDIAENGAVVPVEVTSKIAGTTSIVMMVEKNANPLTADFNLMNGAEGYVSTRIKMGQTSNVRVVVKAGNKSYTAVKEVKVTIGGCGG